MKPHEIHIKLLSADSPISPANALLHPGRLLKDSNNGGLHVRYYLHSGVLCTDSPPRSWVLVFQ